MNRVLIIEDDYHICEILKFYLTQDGAYIVNVVHSSEKAMPEIRMEKYDVILLDIMLPGEDGISFCKKIRQWVFCPIIFISCLNADDTIVRAMNMGGDDYLVKPFNRPILLAYIEANIRRSRMQFLKSNIIQIYELEIETGTHTVRKRGEKLFISPTEYQILCYLAENGGRFISFEEIYNSVWQRPSLEDYRSLFVHIRNLRKKLEDDPTNPVYIVTQRRSGYIFPKT